MWRGGRFVCVCVAARNIIFGFDLFVMHLVEKLQILLFILNHLLSSSINTSNI